MLWLRLMCLLLFVFLSLPSHATGFRLLRLDGLIVKWGESRLGAGAKVTWSFAQRLQNFPDAINCGILVPTDELAEAVGVTSDELRDIVSEAFDLWAEIADLSFTYIGNAEEADILVGAQGRPKDVAFANVWHDPDTDRPIARITRATICLNPLIRWESGADGNETTYEIGQVMAHEIGHAIGLDHPGRTGALMGFKYVEEEDDLQPGDVAGAVTLYGHRAKAQRPARGAVAD